MKSRADITMRDNVTDITVIWFIFLLKIISVFNFGGDLISFCDQTKFI